MTTSVKLKVYQYEPEAIYIDTIEAKSFDDFMIVTLDRFDHQDYESILFNLKENFPDKKILIIPDGMNIAFYGIKEDNDDNGLTDSQLQHKESAEETS